MSEKFVNKTILGDIASVPVDQAVVFSFTFSSSGDIHTNYGSESIYLTVEFQTAGISVSKKLRLARVGWNVDEDEYSKKFFSEIHRTGVSDAERANLGKLVFERYVSGEVTSQDVLSSLEKILSARKEGTKGNRSEYAHTDIVPCSLCLRK